MTTQDTLTAVQAYMLADRLNASASPLVQYEVTRVSYPPQWAAESYGYLTLFHKSLVDGSWFCVGRVARLGSAKA